jgi:GH35 family endo-1,4-beta-xylanase
MRNLLFCFLLVGFFGEGFAQKIDTSINRVKTDFKVDFKRIGTLKPKSTNEIKSSNWIIGCETLDRNFTDYEQYKEYLVPLGIKRLRMQAGWAKTEKTKGVYDWDWMDKIINDAVSRGLEPWLETGYGNTIYEGGGGINLSAGIPSSNEALRAWDKWVAALVYRYKDNVYEWEVWNEPNFGDNEINTPEKVADLNI